MIEDDVDIVQKISIEKLTALINPFERTNWVKLTSPLTIEEVLSSVPISYDIPQKMELIWNVEDRMTHAGRIHWLVLNWSDDFPIDLDFGMPEMGYPSSEIIHDGHHRLMAAMILKKEFINARCSGAVSEIEKYLTN